MLSQLRSARNMKFIMGFVAIAFIVGTIILGVNPGSGGRGAPTSVAIVINGEEVAWQSYSAIVNQLAEIERSRFQRTELNASDYERIEEQAIESVINDVLMRQEATRLGLTASDDEIIATLTQNPPEYIRQRFVDDQGQFDPVQYQRALADPNYDQWVQDEAYLRSVLPTLKLQQMIRARAVVSEIEVRREFQRRNMRNTVKYVGVEWRPIDAAAFSPSDAELRNYQQENAERFSERESVSLEVLRVRKDPSPADRDEILEDAQRALQELANHEYASFGEMAAFWSEDASADRNGRIGWVRQGLLPAEVESAAWALQPGHGRHVGGVQRSAADHARTHR